MGNLLFVPLKQSCIQTAAFSTLYTAIPHDKLKTHLNEMIYNKFYIKNGTQG